MTIVQAVLLGLVQGAAEFLPISSSAHLILAPWLFHFPDPGLSFDVALHFGTLIAVVLYFWKDWIEIFKLTLKNNIQYPISNIQQKSKIQNPKSKVTDYQLPTTSYSKNILWLLVVATIPGAIFGYLFESEAETVFRSPLLIAFTLSLVGLILFLVDKYHKHKKNLHQMTWLDSLWVGLSQAIAVIPWGFAFRCDNHHGTISRAQPRVSCALFFSSFRADYFWGSTGQAAASIQGGVGCLSYRRHAGCHRKRIFCHKVSSKIHRACKLRDFLLVSACTRDNNFGGFYFEIVGLISAYINIIFAILDSTWLDFLNRL